MKTVSGFKVGIAAAAFGVFMFTNAVTAAEVSSCRSIAKAAADEWSAGRVTPVGPADMAGDDGVTVIAYGKKYVMPRNLTSDGALFPQELGSIAKQYNEVYVEELARCQYHGKFQVTIIRK